MSKLPKLVRTEVVTDVFVGAPGQEVAEATTVVSAKPAVRPFDQALSEDTFTSDPTAIPEAISDWSKPELRFWFFVLTNTDGDAHATLSKLRGIDLEADMPFTDAKARLDGYLTARQWNQPSLYQLTPFLRGLFSWSETLSLFYGRRDWEFAHCLEELGPCPDDEEKRRATPHALAYISAELANDSSSRACGELLKHFHCPPAAQTYLAAASRWSLVNDPVPVFLQLEDAATAYKGLRRLKVSLSEAEIGMLLETFGFEAVDQLVRSAATGYLEEAMKVRSSKAVAGWLELAGKPKHADMALHWLVHEGANAIDGLLDFLNRRGKKRDLAIDALVRAAEAGHGDHIRLLAATKPEKVRAALEADVFRAATGPEPLPVERWQPWMLACAEFEVSPKIGELLGTSALPPVIVAGTDYRLPDDVLQGYLSMIIAPGQSSPRISDDLEPRSAAALAWKLIERWQINKGSGTWPFAVLWRFGGPDEATKFGRMVRRAGFEFPKEGSEALRRMESRESLTALVRAYDQGRGAVLNRKRLQKLMKSRGFEDDEGSFRDSIVPTCGLSDLHVIELDFGPRTFTLALTPPSKVLIVDRGTGEVFQKFPPRRKADDPDKHKRARERYKVFKEDLTEVVEAETRRLHDAMLTGREWTREAWLRDISHHPVLGPLACTLVWKTELHGELVTFMPTHPDDSCIRNNYDETALGATVSLLFPADVSEDEGLKWRGVLTDSEIVQPFEQLGRPTFRSGSQASSDLLERILTQQWTDDGLGDAVRVCQFHNGPTDDDGNWTSVTRTRGNWTVRLVMSKPLPRWAWPPSAPAFGISAVEFCRTSDAANEPSAFIAAGDVGDEVPAAIFSETLHDLLNLFDYV